MPSFKEVIDDDFRFFSRLPEETRTACRGAMRYIEELANQTQTRIDSWDLVAVFGNGKEWEIHTDKREINRRYFENLTTANQSPSVLAIKASIATDLDKWFVRIQQQLISAAKDKLSGYDAQIDSFNTAIAKEYKKAADVRVELALLQSRDTSAYKQKFLDEITKILSNKFFVFHSYQEASSSLFFVTAEPVVMKKIVPELGIDISVDFGLFLVSLPLSEGLPRVYPFRDNFIGSGAPGGWPYNIYHPFVNRHGAVCFGNAEKSVHDYVKNQQFSSIFEVLSVLLVTPTTGQPHLALETFYQHKVDHPEWRQKNNSEGLHTSRPGVAQPQPRSHNAVISDAFGYTIAPSTMWTETAARGLMSRHFGGGL